jgi:hypothetical protein
LEERARYDKENKNQAANAQARSERNGCRRLARGGVEALM